MGERDGWLFTLTLTSGHQSAPVGRFCNIVNISLRAAGSYLWQHAVAAEPYNLAPRELGGRARGIARLSCVESMWLSGEGAFLRGTAYAAGRGARRGRRGGGSPFRGCATAAVLVGGMCLLWGRPTAGVDPVYATSQYTCAIPRSPLSASP